MLQTWVINSWIPSVGVREFEPRTNSLPRNIHHVTLKNVKRLFDQSEAEKLGRSMTMLHIGLPSSVTSNTIGSTGVKPRCSDHSTSVVTLHYKASYYKSSSVCLFVCLSVCLSVCSLSPPRSFDRSSPNLVGVCRWTSELPLRGSFSKRSTARRVNGSLSLSTILYMRQPHATRCNGSSCLQLQSLIRHLLLDGYRTASQQCI